MNNEERDAMIQATHGAVIEIQTNCVSCRKAVGNHQRLLHGNGEDGLKTRVALLEKGRTDSPRFTPKQWNALWAAMGTVAGAIGAALVAFAK